MEDPLGEINNSDILTLAEVQNSYINKMSKRIEQLEIDLGI